MWFLGQLEEKETGDGKRKYFPLYKELEQIQTKQNMDI
jgi:hypothetical protein